MTKLEDEFRPILEPLQYALKRALCIPPNYFKVSKSTLENLENCIKNSIKTLENVLYALVILHTNEKILRDLRSVLDMLNKALNTIKSISQ